MATWTTAYIDSLPDSSFLYIAPGGKKVDGKTEPRSLRHFPVKDANGKVDLPHLRNALARIPDSGVPADVKARLKAKAQAMLAAAEGSSRDGKLEVERNADGSTVELRMFGRIGAGVFDRGITADLVADVLEQNPNATIRVKLNSQGGDAFEGDTIRALLDIAPNRIEMQVLGLAASAASVILAAGDHVAMAPTAMVMIHNASANLSGNAAEFRSMLQLLDASDAGAAEVYSAAAKRRGVDVKTATFRSLMDKQTWLSVDKAIEMGLADSRLEAAPVTMDLVDSTGLPEEVVRALWPADPTHATEPDMMISPALLSKLGLPAAATEEQVLAAIDAKNKPAEPTEAQRTAAAQAAALSQAAQLAALQRASATAAVERFISEGRLTPAQRDAAISACGDSPETLAACVALWEKTPVIVGRALSLSLPAGTAPGVKPPRVLTALQKRMCRDACIPEADLIKRLDEAEAG